MSFWLDNWNGLIPSEAFACLYSYAVVEDISVKEFFDTSDMSSLFHLPLSMEAFEELQHVKDLNPITDVEVLDKYVWTYYWGI